MITSTITYLGNLRTQAKHLASGQEIITDAPVDNMGKGEAFSPTDLLSTSLGCCMLTLMGIAAKARDISMEGTKVEIIKIMSHNPRKVSNIKVRIAFKGDALSVVNQEVLKRAALTCPVALSLHPDIIQDIDFVF
jgi:putative redox protein